MFIFGQADGHPRVGGLLGQNGVPGYSSGTEPALQGLRMMSGEQAFGRQCVNWGRLSKHLAGGCKENYSVSISFQPHWGACGAQTSSSCLPEHAAQCFL